MNTPTREELIANRNEIGKCPCCNQNIKDRKIALYRALTVELYHVYKWCGEKRRHEFQMKDIRHLLSRNGYARFGDLVWFGGIIYKNGKAQYGINMERAKAFFSGKSAIPGEIIINQLENRIEEKTYVHISQIKPLTALINTEGLYDHERVIYTK